MSNTILIDTDALVFVKASDDSFAIKRLELYADLLIPKDNDFLITGFMNRDFSCFTIMELKMLYRNHTGNELTTSDYSKALSEVTSLLPDLEMDNTPLENISKPKSKSNITKPEKKKESPNLISLPKEGTTSRALWDLASSLLKQYPDTDINDKEFRDYVIQSAVNSHGMNKATASTQYAKWKKYQGSK